MRASPMISPICHAGGGRCCRALNCCGQPEVALPACRETDVAADTRHAKRSDLLRTVVLSGRSRTSCPRGAGGRTGRSCVHGPRPARWPNSRTSASAASRSPSRACSADLRAPASNRGRGPPRGRPSLLGRVRTRAGPVRDSRSASRNGSAYANCPSRRYRHVCSAASSSSVSSSAGRK